MRGGLARGWKSQRPRFHLVPGIQLESYQTILSTYELNRRSKKSSNYEQKSGHFLEIIFYPFAVSNLTLRNQIDLGILQMLYIYIHTHTRAHTHSTRRFMGSFDLGSTMKYVKLYTSGVYMYISQLIKYPLFQFQKHLLVHRPFGTTNKEQWIDCKVFKWFYIKHHLFYCVFSRTFIFGEALESRQITNFLIKVYQFTLRSE